MELAQTKLDSLLRGSIMFLCVRADVIYMSVYVCVCKCILFTIDALKALAFYIFIHGCSIIFSTYSSHYIQLHHHIATTKESLRKCCVFPFSFL